MRSARSRPATATIIAALSREGDAPAAFAGTDGNALGQVFDDIAAGLPDADLAIPPADYPDLLGAAIADRVVRRPGLPGVRVRILGPLEARLTSSDRLVLGGLNEGTWPPQPRSDAWLSRPMRLELGLDLPERRIGLSAHDFAQMLGAREVILTRAAKLAGRPYGGVALRAAAGRGGGPALANRARARREISRLGARARPARTRRRARRRGRSPGRRSRRGRRGSRSPRSSIGCATPTRSMPSTSCGCSRSIRSTRHRAPPTAAP